MTSVDSFLLHKWRIRRHNSGLRLIDSKQESNLIATSPESSHRELKTMKPTIKFSQVAKTLIVLTRLCQASRCHVLESISHEPWYTRLDDLEVSTTDTPRQKTPRSFVTFLQREVREIQQLTFNLSGFKRTSGESALTEPIRSTLSKPANQRSHQRIPEAICSLKALCETFRNYPLSIQRNIAHLAWYEKYHGNTVIMKEGGSPDGIYFILSGSLIEKQSTKRQANDVTVGTLLGESDVVFDRRRQATVLTRNTTELLFLHRLDYKRIFEMADDLNDISLLDVAKQHPVFQHFPTQKLEENPEFWTIVNYKHGRVIATDSNNLEWIFVINSGEARVLKYLNPGNVNVLDRRKKTQTALQTDSPFHMHHKLLNFISERDQIHSPYSTNKYHPLTQIVKSAPPLSRPRNRSYVLKNTAGSGRSKTSSRHESPLFPLTQAGQSLTSNGIKSTPKSGLGVKNPDVEIRPKRMQRVSQGIISVPLLKVEEVSDAEENSDGISVMTSVGELKSQSPVDNEVKIETKSSMKEAEAFKTHPESRQVMAHRNNAQNTQFKKTTQEKVKSVKVLNARFQKIQPGDEISYGKLPAFVQLEVLSQGEIFGLRACLEPEERGPSVSLVSADCEVLQVNKKFFMKHCDDALIAIIRHKAKPFPSDEELIDRLDVNLRWEEYKQTILRDFMKQRWHYRR